MPGRTLPKHPRASAPGQPIPVNPLAERMVGRWPGSGQQEPEIDQRTAAQEGRAHGNAAEFPHALLAPWRGGRASLGGHFSQVDDAGLRGRLVHVFLSAWVPAQNHAAPLPGGNGWPGAGFRGRGRNDIGLDRSGTKLADCIKRLRKAAPFRECIRRSGGSAPRPPAPGSLACAGWVPSCGRSRCSPGARCHGDGPPARRG
jgi:hypothetical protein